MNRTVYNSPNSAMHPFSRLRWAWCLLIITSQLAKASDWRSLESQIAARIVAISGPGVIALDIANRSSIPAQDIPEIQRGIVSALGESGVRVWQPEQAAATVKVTLSENLENYIWIAEIQQGAGDPVVVMVSTPRPDGVSNARSVLLVTIQVVPLVSQADPILDAAVLEGPHRRMLVLSTTQVSVYEYKEGKWVATQALPVSHEHPFPRDVRGRIVLRKDHLFDAYLPGVDCQSSGSAPLAMACAQRDNPWPLQSDEFKVSGFFAPARNFFTGALVPAIGQQKSAPAFYSAAAVPRDKYTLWILAGVDGQLHLLDGITERSLPRGRWGSDVAGVHAVCRGTWAVLASAESDGDDSIQAFEFPDREPIAVSQKWKPNGNLTALWTSGAGENAIAVYHSTETGNYEAVQLSLACSQ